MVVMVALAPCSMVQGDFTLHGSQPGGSWPLRAEMLFGVGILRLRCAEQLHVSQFGGSWPLRTGVAWAFYFYAELLGSCAAARRQLLHRLLLWLHPFGLV